MKKPEKRYQCEGLIVDAVSAQNYRLVMCMTSTGIYQLILIGMWGDKVDALRWNETKFYKDTISRSELASLLGVRIVRVKQAKKIRVVCS